MKDDSNNNKQLKFTEREIEFLLENEVCRIATSYKDIPHITTVSYIYENGLIYFATDYSTRKYQILEENKRIAVIVDIYNSSIDNKAVVIQGIVEFIEKSKEFKRPLSKIR
jgi:nitroimidazol reductase NimA-like FMN-containing flavoprotein (pyridoxamine 5'-phosphate oxidase superfamily)